MDFYVLATVLLIAVAFVLIPRVVPRCPECGSFWVSNLRDMPFRICDRCQAVWRIQ